MGKVLPATRNFALGDLRIILVGGKCGEFYSGPKGDFGDEAFGSLSGGREEKKWPAGSREPADRLRVYSLSHSHAVISRRLPVTVLST